MTRGDRGMIEKAKAHRLVGLGVVAGRPHPHERIMMLAGHHSVGGCDRAADAAHHGLPGAGRHRGIAIEIDQALGRRDAPQLVHIMLVVTQRHQIEAAFRRFFFAHQGAEAIFRQQFVEGTNSIGPFGMARRRQMIEGCRMRQEKCCHAGDPASSMWFARNAI